MYTVAQEWCVQTEESSTPIRKCLEQLLSKHGEGIEYLICATG